MADQDGTFTDTLKRLYYSLEEPSSYSSARILHQAAKKQGLTITLDQVKSWLRKQVTYTRHKKYRLTFPRRKVLTLRIDYCWSADLISVDSLSNYNSGYNYILTVIDLFSKKLWLRKLKKKSTVEMDLAMRSIIESNGGQSPYKLWTDLGYC